MARVGTVFKICRRHFLRPFACTVFNKVLMKCLPNDPKWAGVYSSNPMHFRYSSFSNKCQKDREGLEQNDQTAPQRPIESPPFVMELHKAIVEMLNSGKMPDDASLLVLADAFIKGDEVDVFLNQLILDFENDLASSMESIVILIRSFIKINKLIAAYSLFRALRNRGAVPKLVVYNSLLTAAEKAGDFNLACHVFKDLLAHGTPNSTSYFSLSKALAKAGDAEIAYKFCMELAKDSFLCNTTALNRLIYAFAGTGQAKTALRLFEYMKHWKYKPDQVTYNTIVDVLGKSGQVDAAFREFSAMKDLGHDPDIITYNTLITNYSRFGRLELCSMLLQEMSERGFEPDLRIYTAIIDRFGRIGKVDEAMRLFNEMKQRGCKASIYVYKSLISTLRKAGNLDLANKLSEEMKVESSNLIGPRDFKKKRR